MAHPTKDDTSENDYVRISQEMLYAARVGESTQRFEDMLANASINSLLEQLNDNAKKKTFFINLYNAYIIALLKKDVKMYENRNHFFSSKQITLAQTKISLDIIEHGILRKSEWKYGGGYIKRWFPSKFEKLFRLQHQDYRIHFALNCGANSCPAVAYYESDKIEDQLVLAEKVFVSNECKLINVSTVKISSIFKWFKGDFGGKNGLVKLLKKYRVIDESQQKIKIIYQPYDWNINLGKFRE